MCCSRIQLTEVVSGAKQVLKGLCPHEQLHHSTALCPKVATDKVDSLLTVVLCASCVLFFFRAWLLARFSEVVVFCTTGTVTHCVCRLRMPFVQQVRTFMTLSLLCPHLRRWKQPWRERTGRWDRLCNSSSTRRRRSGPRHRRVALL
jgi:hypothetical protein